MTARADRGWLRETMARAALRHGYAGRVTCGHCCSLALQDEAQARAVINLLVEAGVSVVRWWDWLPHGSWRQARRCCSC